MNNYPENPYKSPDSNPRKQGDNWAMLCHISALIGFVIPFGHILGPLVIWLFKRDEYAAVAFHGKEAVNFQIAMTIYFFIAALMIFIFIGMVLLPLLAIFWFIWMILASLRAADGQPYRYPLIFRLI